MDEDNKLVWDKIKEAGKEGSELVVFPEMLGNSRTEEYISTRLKELTVVEREKIPAMIVLPSVYYDNQNTSSVLDRNGNRLAKQYKQNPFVMNTKEGDFMEDIIGENTINIFHY